MRKITIVWTITLIIIVSVLTFIGFKYKEKNIDSIMEEELIKQAEKYLGLYPSLYPSLGNSARFTSEKLADEGYDAKLEDGCSGYVVVETKNTGFDYKAYIKCPNYMTMGYSQE